MQTNMYGEIGRQYEPRNSRINLKYTFRAQNDQHVI